MTTPLLTVAHLFFTSAWALAEGFARVFIYALFLLLFMRLLLGCSLSRSQVQAELVRLLTEVHFDSADAARHFALPFYAAEVFCIGASDLDRCEEVSTPDILE